MTVAVIVPYTSTCPHRDAAWEWVRRKFETEHPEWQILVGSAGEPWCKAEAAAAAITQTTADTLIISDADVWTDALPAAIAVVDHGAQWVSPRSTIRRLTEYATAEVLDGAPFTFDLPLETPDYLGTRGGGIVVLTRDAWNTAPLDATFTGWGQEDQAWALALHGLVGPPVILDQPHWPLWHLWHPPANPPHRRAGSHEALDRYRAYQRAKRPEQLRRLVEGGRP